MGWKAHDLARCLPLVWLRRFRNLVFDLNAGPVVGPTVGLPSHRPLHSPQ
jgi:hypothetical protein